MKRRIISFALGNIWRWDESNNRNALIGQARQLPVSGVELTMATKEDLYALRLSEENKAWLKRLDYVTIHAPFGLFGDAVDETEVLRQLQIIKRLYLSINAKNVIVHPEKELLTSQLLKTLDVHVSVENLPKRSGVSVSMLRDIFRIHPDMGLCLDVSHAYSWSRYETGHLIAAFSDRISQVHLSGSYRKRDHQSLRRVSEAFKLSIEPVLKLDVPLVIEEDIKIKSMAYVVEEVQYITNLFA